MLIISTVRRRNHLVGTFRAMGLCLFASLLTLPDEGATEEPRDPDPPTHNLFGVTGLIDTPTAEMQPDGQLSFTSSFFGGYLRNTLSAQILPGVEAAFRYSVLDNLGGGGDKLYDRSFDVKLRLIEESPAWPSVVLGLQDFLGTGIYGGEYFAATKGFLDGNLKVTGGIGWGRFAGANSVDNPFCKASDRFCDREVDVDEGGKVDFGSFFSGEDLGFFGGVEWQTPVEHLMLKAEFSSDDYDQERATSDFERKIPFNFGLDYRPFDSVSVGAYYMYGSEIGLRLTLGANPFRPLAGADNEPAPVAFKPRNAPDQATSTKDLGEIRIALPNKAPTRTMIASGVADVTVESEPNGVRWAVAELSSSTDFGCPEAAARAIDAELGLVDAVTFRHADGRLICTVALRHAGQQAIRERMRAGIEHSTDWYGDERLRGNIMDALVAALDPERIGLFGISFAPDRVAVYIENKRFRSMPRAIGRTARALAATMPASVELFEIIPVEGSLPVVSVMLERSALEDYVERPNASRSAWLAARVTDASAPDWREVEGSLRKFPRFAWSVSPFTPVNVFDPDQPFRADLSIVTEGRVEVLPGLSVSAAAQKRVVGNLDDIERESDSELPRVRSDIARYLREGDPGISRLSVDYVTKLDDAVYGRMSVGLLEWMHGGVSGEVLWKPAYQDWGVGVEANWTQQRDFNMLFDFQDYDVVTGHASLYFDTDFYDISGQIDVGRYLAGDWGGTFSLKRRFANGWEIGAFFTLTDVPFDEFGEGSFDKGLTITIPFNWMLPLESRSAYRTVLRPLTRDGGQRLQVANRLYPLVEDMDRSGLRTNWESFWE